VFGDGLSLLHEDAVQAGQWVRYLPLTHGAFHISCQTAPALHDVALCFSRGATREGNSSPILHRPWTWVTPNQGTSFSHVEQGADDDGHMLGGKQSQLKYPVTSDTLPPLSQDASRMVMVPPSQLSATPAAFDSQMPYGGHITDKISQSHYRLPHSEYQIAHRLPPYWTLTADPDIGAGELLLRVAVVLCPAERARAPYGSGSSHRLFPTFCSSPFFCRGTGLSPF